MIKLGHSFLSTSSAGRGDILGQDVISVTQFTQYQVNAGRGAPPQGPTLSRTRRWEGREESGG